MNPILDAELAQTQYLIKHLDISPNTRNINPVIDAEIIDVRRWK